jgi:glutamine synthetase
MQEDEKNFRVLPRSCSESAHHLQKDRKLYEVDGVFPGRLIDKVVHKLNDYKDRNLWRDILEKPEELQKVLAQYLNYG